MLIAQHLPNDLLDRHRVLTGHLPASSLSNPEEGPTMMSAAVGRTTYNRPSDALLHHAAERDREPRRRSRSASPNPQRLVDAKPGAPQHDDQPTQSASMGAVTSLVHDRGDLLMLGGPAGGAVLVTRWAAA
jgi:hypothetical protein